jgi:hypothetical protein
MPRASEGPNVYDTNPALDFCFDGYRRAGVMFLAGRRKNHQISFVAVAAEHSDVELRNFAS